MYLQTSRNQKGWKWPLRCKFLFTLHELQVKACDVSLASAWWCFKSLKTQNVLQAYRLQVLCNDGKPYYISRRFRQFEDLHRKVQNQEATLFSLSYAHAKAQPMSWEYQSARWRKARLSCGRHLLHLFSLSKLIRCKRFQPSLRKGAIYLMSEKLMKVTSFGLRRIHRMLRLRKGRGRIIKGGRGEDKHCLSFFFSWVL